MSLGKIAMLIPLADENLCEPHSSFGHASRQQTICSERAWFLDLGAVHVQDMLRFIREIGQFRNRGLHAVRHFVLRNSRLDFRVTDFRETLAIEFRQFVQHPTPHLLTHAVRIGKIQYRVAIGSQADPLMTRGKKTGTPKSSVQRLPAESAIDRRMQDNKRRQVLVHAAQSVRQPGTGTGPTRQLATGLDVGDRRIVVDRFGVDRFDHGQIVDDTCSVRKQLADPNALLCRVWWNLKVEGAIGKRS